MDLNFPNFRMEILQREYHHQDHSFPATAEVTWLNERGEEETKELYGIPDREEIFAWIESGKEICLDHCYLHAFSLSEYRLSRGMDKKEPVVLKDFSASHALFDAVESTDFSYARFEGERLDFSYARFVRGKAVFNTCRFAEVTDFSYTRFYHGELDFANTVFPGKGLEFKNALIGDGKKDFQYADFGDSNVHFMNTEFGYGELSFINSHFGKGDVSFKVARIDGGKVDFRYARFGCGDISFERTEFGNSRVDFRTTEFHDGRVNFNRAVFGDGDISFEGSELGLGKFSFKRAQMGSGEFNFEMVEFGEAEAFFDRTSFGHGQVSFHMSKIGTLSLKACHLDHYTDLRVKYCGLMDLSDTVVRDIIDLKPYDYQVDIRVLDLSAMRLLGVIYIGWEENQVRQMIYAQKKSTHAVKAEQFRVLKENFNNTGQYSYEDASYVEFKRCEAKALRNKSIGKKKINALWQYPWYGFKWLVLDYAGLYATSPLRVLIAMGGWYVLFSLCYWVFGLTGHSEIVSSTGYTLEPMARSFYHSAITFLTIGYGDHFPVGIARVISSIEGFFGMFMMSYFTVSLVRKILR